jgi:uncharacterized membrane protein
MNMAENNSTQVLTSVETVAQQKAAWLARKIKESIEDTRRNKKRNQNRASYIKIAIIFLSSAVTVLLGLQILGMEKSFKDIAFTLGAIVTLLNALEPFFNFRNLWIEHEVALASFHRLEDKLEFYMTGNDPSKLSLEEIESFHDEYQAIWRNFGKAWISYRKSDSEKGI